MTSSTGSQPRSNGVVPPIRLDHLFGMHFCKSPKSLNVPMTPYCFVKYIRFNSNLLPNLAIWHHKFLPISGIFQKLTSYKRYTSLSTATPGSHKRSTFFFPTAHGKPLRKIRNFVLSSSYDHLGGFVMQAMQGGAVTSRYKPFKWR